MQRVLLQYFMPKNQRRVIEALEKAGRCDLIGTKKECLVKPDAEYLRKQQLKAASSQKGRREVKNVSKSKKPSKRR